MVHHEPDEELVARLDSALRSDLGSSSVDVVALLAGSHRRARRVRSQRIAVVVAVGALVVAVPVGYEVIRPEPNVIVQSAAMLPSSLLTDVPWSATPTLSATQRPATTRQRQAPAPIGASSTSKAQAIPTPTVSAVHAVPDSVAFNATELPDLKLNSDIADPNQPTVSGQSCDPGAPNGARPITGRQWAWVDSSGKMTSTSVNLIVTGWKRGTGKLAFDQLVADTGFCRWSDPQTKVDFSTKLSDQSWSGTSVSSVDSALKYGRVVIRLGDVIAGIEVQDARGTDAAVKLAGQLAVDSCKHLRASGLTAVK
jgi:hypothetical protein